MPNHQAHVERDAVEEARYHQSRSKETVLERNTSFGKVTRMLTFLNAGIEQTSILIDEMTFVFGDSCNVQ